MKTHGDREMVEYLGYLVSIDYFPVGYHVHAFSDCECVLHSSFFRVLSNIGY